MMKQKPIRRRTEREKAQLGPRALKDPNSVAFAWQTVEWLQDRFHGLAVSTDSWQRAIDEAEQYQIYLRVPPEHPYGSMDALLKAEIGYDRLDSIAAKAQQGARTAQPQPTKSEAMVGNANAKKENSGDNVTSVFQAKKRGNHAAYLTARIARDRPDILEAMKAGLYPSVRAAAKAAGIIKTETPVARVLRLYRTWSALYHALSAEDQADFKERIAVPSSGDEEKTTRETKARPAARTVSA